MLRPNNDKQPAPPPTTATAAAQFMLTGPLMMMMVMPPVAAAAADADAAATALLLLLLLLPLLAPRSQASRRIRTLKHRHVYISGVCFFFFPRLAPSTRTLARSLAHPLTRTLARTPRRRWGNKLCSGGIFFYRCCRLLLGYSAATSSSRHEVRHKLIFPLLELIPHSAISQT